MGAGETMRHHCTIFIGFLLTLFAKSSEENLIHEIVPESKSANLLTNAQLKWENAELKAQNMQFKRLNQAATRQISELQAQIAKLKGFTSLPMKMGVKLNQAAARTELVSRNINPYTLIF